MSEAKEDPAATDQTSVTDEVKEDEASAEDPASRLERMKERRRVIEEENKRKSMLLMPETNGRAGNAPLETWDYVYRQLETIGYTKDQVNRF